MESYSMYSFSVWLLSLGITVLRSIHVAALLLVSVVHSSLLLSGIPLYEHNYLYIYIYNYFILSTSYMPGTLLVCSHTLSFSVLKLIRR